MARQTTAGSLNKGEGASRPPVRDRIEAFVRVRAGELKEHPGNWRRHPERQRAALRGLLDEVGYADALLARRDEGSLVLIDGHLRRSLDPDQVVPVLVLDVSASEADLLLASLDPLAALAKPDQAALAELLSRVSPGADAVADLLEGLARAAGLPLSSLLADPEQIPPVPSEPRTRPGDLWMIGSQRLLCGDATSAPDMSRLMSGEKAHVLWTDPPYGVDYVGKTRAAMRIKGDSATGLTRLLAESFSNASAVLYPGARIYLCHPAGAQSGVFLQAFEDQGWRLHQALVWVKDHMVLGHGDYHYRHEPILYGYVPGPGRWGRGSKGWYGGNDQDSVIEVPRPNASPDHPTAKPVELIRRLISNSSRRGDRVLDPFCGSGATLVACELLGRSGHAMEIDPGYCDVAIRRLEAITGAKATRKRQRR